MRKPGIDGQPSPVAVYNAAVTFPADSSIVVQHLTKHYGALAVVDDLSFAVAAGEIVGFLGPNGAGKTTTLGMLLGLLRPTRGRVEILGLQMPAERQRILSRVNFTSPYVSLPGNLTVGENLAVFARLYGVRRPRARVEALLDRFGLAGMRDRTAGRLSSGEGTRLGLVKALLNDPEVLFLDEPTASLDPDGAERVRDALKEIRAERGMTIFYTSHNMQEVERLSDRILFLHRGRLLAEGPPGDVLRRFERDTLEHMFLDLAREEAPSTWAR
ncbi:MAG TPA: ABC transporter ATP-binding protein [bacterium]|nr:ABC transporter ATP-binding protein [bacterium]